MKRTVSILIVVLVTVVASGCCGGLECFLHHPFGPNTICEPVHRAHYDNGFEVGYGSECDCCGIGPAGAGPVCSCEQYGAGTATGCLTCAMSDDPEVSAQVSKKPQVTKASRMAKMDHGIKQVSYTTGCTDCGCSDCVESEASSSCGGCVEEVCECCPSRCPDACCECCCHPGPLSWLFTLLHPEKYYGGCGEIYWGDFHSYPPDCTDPCNRCGNWTGRQNCNAWTGCNVCGQCDANYSEPCQTCNSSAVSKPMIAKHSKVVEGPVLISQTDRVVRPEEARTASAKRSTYR